MATKYCILLAFLLHFKFSEPYADSVNDSVWSYSLNDGTGPKYWKKLYPDCGLSNQSPIDIRYSEVRKIKIVKKQYGPVNISTVEPLGSKTLKNLARSLVIPVPERNIEVRGGCVEEKTYRVHEIRFHWGSIPARGSEHRIGGVAFPLEVQFLATSKIRQPDVSDNAGLAFLFETRKVDNPHLITLVEAIQEVTEPGSEAKFDAREFLDYLTSSKRLRNYYCYFGSDTSPPCSENYTWTVFVYAHLIGEEQMNSFRSVVSRHRDLSLGGPIMMSDNFRDVQDREDTEIILVSSAWATTRQMAALVISYLVSVFCILFT